MSMLLHLRAARLEMMRVPLRLEIEWQWWIGP
jgi:hypothetical protein